MPALFAAAAAAGMFRCQCSIIPDNPIFASAPLTADALSTDAEPYPAPRSIRRAKADRTRIATLALYLLAYSLALVTARDET